MRVEGDSVFRRYGGGSVLNVASVRLRSDRILRTVCIESDVTVLPLPSVSLPRRCVKEGRDATTGSFRCLTNGIPTSYTTSCLRSDLHHGHKLETSPQPLIGSALGNIRTRDCNCLTDEDRTIYDALHHLRQALDAAMEVAEGWCTSPHAFFRGPILLACDTDNKQHNNTVAAIVYTRGAYTTHEARSHRCAKALPTC